MGRLERDLDYILFSTCCEGDVQLMVRWLM